MDVQCERCKTEYEFDDALVSGRGTTVKCTNCGFQFKVRKTTGTDDATADDRWLVRTTKDGQSLVFTSLKELQRAILAKTVGRHDTLTRGNAPPRALGSIAELAPFFDEKRRMSSVAPPASTPPPPFAAPPPPRKATMVGVGIGEARTGNTPPMGSPVRPRSTPPPLGVRPNPSRPPPPAIASEPPPKREKVDTLRPPHSALPPPPTVPKLAPMASLTDALEARPDSSASSVATTMGLSPPVIAPESARPQNVSRVASVHPELSSPLPAPTAPIMRGSIPSYDDGDPMRVAMHGDDSVLLPGVGSRRRVGGWVIAALLLGCVSLGVFLMAKPYLEGGGGPKTAASAPLDPRAQEFLRSGERALDDGDFDTSKENFDKASVVADKDPRVLVDLARLAATRADVPWLKQRLIADDDTKRTLDDFANKAKSAADLAMVAAPDDPAAIRAKIDALRIAGDRDAARGFVSRVIANASQPETAYVLGALDLAEPEPLWQTIIERLRVAAQAEGNAGRARAALVYALARSGDQNGARTELDKLSKLSRPHPLASALKAFVEKAPAKTRLDGGASLASASAPAVDVSTLPKDRPLPANDPGLVPSGDSKSLVIQANNAYLKRDYARASQLYAAALDKNPSDSEAQGGLGDVAHAQRDLAGAKSSYAKAIAINSHFLSAHIGLGDVMWEMGDHAGAQKEYKDIVENFPDGSYPARVSERAKSAPPAAAPTDKPLPSFPIPPPDPTTAPPAPAASAP